MYASNDAAKSGLAAAGLAHEPKNLAFLNIQAYIVDRVYSFFSDTRAKFLRNLSGKIQAFCKPLGDTADFYKWLRHDITPAMPCGLKQRKRRPSTSSIGGCALQAAFRA
jgi:hypothetical protein